MSPSDYICKKYEFESDDALIEILREAYDAVVKERDEYRAALEKIKQHQWVDGDTCGFTYEAKIARDVLNELGET